MASKPILSAAIAPAFRSFLERDIAAQLDGVVKYGFETKKVPYTVPQREAKYLPDFVIEDTNILIEGKGRFGGGNPKFKQPAIDGATERQKLILVKEQNPHLDIRIVFQKASTPIYKTSKTTYGKWATDHGFKWSDKGIVPPEWLAEMKQKQTK